MQHSQNPTFPTPLSEQAVDETYIENVNAFPLAGYLKIYNEYFANPRLKDFKEIKLQEGDNTLTESLRSVDTPPKDKLEKPYLTNSKSTPYVGYVLSTSHTDRRTPHSSGIQQPKKTDEPTQKSRSITQ